MNIETENLFTHLSQGLATLYDYATAETGEVVGTENIPDAVAHYADLRDIARELAEKVSALQKHVDSLSYELLPTLFQNQNVKTILVKDVGRVSIVERWSASMLNKERALEWLRSTGNGSIIIETVNASTLGAFARTENEARRPLPTDIFRAAPTPHISITKS